MSAEHIAIDLMGESTAMDATFQDRPPATDRVNAYDEGHLAIYVRLLMAEEEGADWREVVRVLFGVDPVHEPERAKIVHDSHLTRARWMTEIGYSHLLEPRVQRQ